MPIHWLFTMNTLTGRLYCAMHESSWMFIRIEASPAKSMTRASGCARCTPSAAGRSEEHTSELQSLMRISYAVLCLKKKNRITTNSCSNKEQTKYIKHTQHKSGGSEQ